MRENGGVSIALEQLSHLHVRVAMVDTYVLVAVAVAVVSLLIAAAMFTQLFMGRDPLPAVLPMNGITQKDPNTLAAFVNNMEEYGFNILEMGDAESDVVDSVRNAASDYFALPLEVKQEQVMKHKEDPEMLEILRSRKINHGFVHIEGMKEFLKLSNDDRVPDPEIPDFKQLHNNAFDLFERVTLNGLEALSKREMDDGNPIWNPDAFGQMEPFIRQKSSISHISYFEHEHVYGEYFHSEEHRDTGLLTLILCSDVPGLQVQDKVTKEYMDVETLVNPLTHVFVIMGLKVNLFSKQSGVYEPTVHRVSLPPNTKRQALLYFQDIP